MSTLNSESQIYVSEKSSGHKITFLIIKNDSVIIEKYKIQGKLINYGLTRDKTLYPITKKTDEIIHTNNFDIKIKNKDTLRINNINYLLRYSTSKCGHFVLLDNSFCRLNNEEKLNVCRNWYFLLHPPKEFEKELRQKTKSLDELKNKINFRQDLTLFIEELNLQQSSKIIKIEKIFIYKDFCKAGTTALLKNVFKNPSECQINAELVEVNETDLKVFEHILNSSKKKKHKQMKINVDLALLVTIKSKVHYFIVSLPGKKIIDLSDNLNYFVNNKQLEKLKKIIKKYKN